MKKEDFDFSVENVKKGLRHNPDKKDNNIITDSNLERELEITILQYVNEYENFISEFVSTISTMTMESFEFSLFGAESENDKDLAVRKMTEKCNIIRSMIDDQEKLKNHINVLIENIAEQKKRKGERVNINTLKITFDDAKSYSNFKQVLRTIKGYENSIVVSAINAKETLYDYNKEHSDDNIGFPQIEELYNEYYTNNVFINDLQKRIIRHSFIKLPTKKRKI